ncbi:MAG TPA: Ig-like domain-containing protein, partial [Candidatus Angelobacter sp.]|nr:Ig-like domain-containing protein [Candidatus Angelobacter sp.]
MNSPRVFSAATLLLFFSCLFAGNASAQTCTATVDKTVKICAPLNGATVTSPVTFSAGALDKEHTVTAMIMYIDSVQKAKSTTNSLTAIVSLAA